jgi:DNA-binding CsgD family transcriptional regulator
MSAGRVIVDGNALEVAGRFETADEIAAFVDRLWTAFYVINPDAPEPDSFVETEKPIDLPEMPRRAAVMAGLDPAIHEIPAQRPVVDPNDARGSDAEKKAPASQPSTRDQTSAAPQAFAQLSPQERRAVMLMRKYKDRNKVAQEMEIGVGTVAVYLSTARKKGVSA